MISRVAYLATLEWRRGSAVTATEGSDCRARHDHRRLSPHGARDVALRAPS